MTALKSSISIRSSDGCTPIHELNRLQLRHVSKGSQWQGMHLETGISGPCHGEDLVLNGHLVSLHPEAKPLPAEVRDQRNGSWISCTHSPSAFWIHPEGQPFSLRHGGGTVEWTAATIDSSFLDAVMGGHHELQGGLSIVDPVLEHLFRALLCELASPSARPELTKQLVRGFVIALASRHAKEVGAAGPTPGLTEAQLEFVLGWVSRNLDAQLTVADIAAQVGLSASYFSREFKRMTGKAPWHYVMWTRLDKARELLLCGESVVDTAGQCGFFDQAHLAKLFKQRFRTTPAAFAKDWRDAIPSVQ